MVFVLTLLIIVMCSSTAFSTRQKMRDMSALPEPSEDVRRLVREQRKVEAIRTYRRQTGASLLEACHVVGRQTA